MDSSIWDRLLLVIVALVAVYALVRLMIARRNDRILRLRAEKRNADRASNSP